MRLALVVRTLGTQGGTERFVHGLARYLLGSGHKVDVWCARVDLEVPGVNVRALRPTGRGRMGRMLAMDLAASRIPREQYDLVLGFIRTGHHDIYRAGGGCHAAWMEGRPWSLADQLELYMDRRAVDAARCTVVNSDMAGREIIERYGVAPEQVRLVRNGVDLERFSPGREPAPGLPENAVCFLGSGFVRKGLETAIRAVAPMAGLHLVVAGSDRRAARFLDVARRLGMEDRLHLLGAVADPASVLVGCRVMILPTRYDPFANSCLESLACGVPVVTSARNGAAEILPKDWMTVARPDDVEGFGVSLERALQEPELGPACRAVAEAHPAEHAFAGFQRVVEELAS